MPSTWTKCTTQCTGYKRKKRITLYKATYTLCWYLHYGIKFCTNNRASNALMLQDSVYATCTCLVDRCLDSWLYLL